MRYIFLLAAIWMGFSLPLSLWAQEPPAPAPVPVENKEQTPPDNPIEKADSPPVLVSPGNKSVNENTLLTFGLSATDPDGDTVTYSMTKAPTNSTLNFVTGIFSWTPTYEQSGSYVITFTVRTKALSDSKAITITVNN